MYIKKNRKVVSYDFNWLKSEKIIFFVKTFNNSNLIIAEDPKNNNLYIEIIFNKKNKTNNK